MAPQGLEKMMEKLGATGLLPAVAGRGSNPVSVETDEAVALSVEEATIESTHGTCSVSEVTRLVDLPLTTVCKIVRKLLLYYPYENKLIQKLKIYYPF
ncbi:hypothetical protein AVEN_263488-1 [Araneus ventricosus]|uniref:Uncharacterized protein n=1 Tax=Araneus ventricosus TaxID=182803 RepID=A0A4Y2EYQ9_ARAVE|nr:hypothetical protein AVEN_263488-1 [Araneus ventricosus]